MKTFLFVIAFFIGNFLLSAQSPAENQAQWADTLRANALFKQAVILRDSSEMDKALSLFRECADIWHNLMPDGSRGAARSAHQMGYCLFQIGKYREADSVLQRTLVTQQRVLPPDGTLRGSILHLLGVNNMERGYYREATNYFQKVLTIYTLRLGRESLRTADVLSDLGKSLGYAGRFRENTSMQEAALAIRQKVLPANAIGIGHSCMALGEAYKTVRRYPEALVYFEQALDIYTQNKHDLIAYAYSEIGLVHLVQKDPQKALAFFEKQREMMVQLGEGEHPTFGYTCRDLGRAYYALGRFAEAIEWDQKAIHLFQKGDGPDNPMMVPLHQQLGLAQAANGQFEAAMASLAESRRILHLVMGPEAENYHHINSDLADVYALWYDRTGADSLLRSSRAYYAKACNTMEQQFKEQTNSVLQKKYLYDAVPIMERAVYAEYRWLQRFPHDRTALETAWRYSEYLHGFLLNNAVQESEAKKIAGIPEALLEREAQLRLRLTELEKYGTRLVQNKGLPLTHPEVLSHHAQQVEVQTAYEALIQEFAQQYPAYHRLKYELAPTPLQDIQRQLKPGQTVLEYFTGDSSIFAFVVRPDTALLIRICHDFPLALWVAQFREGVFGYHAASVKTPAQYERTVRQYARTAHDLYQKLLAPVARWLTPEVLIVPDAMLNYLPFEALVSGTPGDVSNFKTYPFVVLERNISYAYSATLQHQLKNKTKTTPAPDLFLGFAPFFSGDTAALSLRLAQEWASLRNGLQSLPYSGEEVLRAGRRIKGTKTVVTGTEATRERFLSLSGRHRILHLATHAKANEKTGEWSYIAFAPASNDSTGLLYAGDVYNLSLNADLVVLSACETGTGELQYGEGVISLARAFYYAGARSVATSLWKVNDQAIMRITDQFYAAWAKKKSKNTALTDAKRHYLQTYPGANAHPFFWAGLVLTGE